MRSQSPFAGLVSVDNVLSGAAAAQAAVFRCDELEHSAVRRFSRPVDAQCVLFEAHGRPLLQREMVDNLLALLLSLCNSLGDRGAVE
ncbi:hypothetical protein [Nocardia cyriacigeorgica]|uniref:hypothetical protein n=1 Tax=Nocardia cyriacigeorgica TaxID=135487 RepID=UPI001B85BBBF|nr:hypothetical protein [Nocardia cyriacigeorgica]